MKEPTAYLMIERNTGERHYQTSIPTREEKISHEPYPIYNTWVGLTPEEIDDIIADAIDPMDALIQTMDKLKEKNTSNTEWDNWKSIKQIV